MQRKTSPYIVALSGMRWRVHTARREAELKSRTIRDRCTRKGGYSGGVMVWMTISELCQELDIARSTFDAWKLRGKTPRMVRLPNGEFRIRRTDFESWLDELVAA